MAMRTDKELADAVVALGVVRLNATSHTFYFDEGETLGRSDHKLVRSWAVAGALMEKCPSGSWILMDSDKWHGAACRNESANESLPRAIIEACVEALT